MNERRWWWIALVGFCLIGLGLRLRGLHAPLLDHPGWRQGDTAAIARNFALLNFNPFFPQTEYNGPPPHYVELELQIVPFLAAICYKLFGIHEVFGRLVAIAFGVGTIALVGSFARWLFASTAAGIAALALYAILPGTIYYARTFQPDGAMVFFLVAGLYAYSRWVVDQDARSWSGGTASFALLATAFLAKPVALIALIPMLALAIARYGLLGWLRRRMLPIAIVTSVIPLALYDPYVASHAEWHWASGIMRLHVLPDLRRALTHVSSFERKAEDFARALRMLATTMLGPIGILLFAGGLLERLRSKADALLYGWLFAGLGYIYVVVTVEKVDYYLFPIVPLGAIVAGALVARLIARVPTATNARRLVVGGCALAWLGTLVVSERLIAPYYVWSRPVYAEARTLDRTLPADALIVMGHYDPSIMYYIRRKGWMEDPLLWTPRDEASAIRKGSRYYVSVEEHRLRANPALCAWLQQFPVLDRAARWPVYHTDPLLVAPSATRDWQSFESAAAHGGARAWVDEHAPRACRLEPTL